LASKVREVGLYDFTIYDVIRRNSMCCKERPAWLEVSDGGNVYPAEAEKAILQHPAIERTVVFGVPDPKWKEGIKAVWQLKEGKSLDPQELISFVGERIARFKRPHYVEFVRDLPLLDENGLPDRGKAKDLYGQEIGKH
jgi:acyl-CoA synthetase (AMP-forming)/AMP-acid ligase II